MAESKKPMSEQLSRRQFLTGGWLPKVNPPEPRRRVSAEFQIPQGLPLTSRREFLELSALVMAGVTFGSGEPIPDFWAGPESLSEIGQAILRNKTILLSRWESVPDAHGDFWDATPGLMKGDCEDSVFQLWNIVRGMGLSGNRRLEGHFWWVGFDYYQLTMVSGKTDFQRLPMDASRLPGHAVLAVGDPSAPIGTDWYVADNGYMVGGDEIFGPLPTKPVTARAFADATQKWGSTFVSTSSLQRTLRVTSQILDLPLPLDGVTDGQAYKQEVIANHRLIYQRRA